MIKKKVATLILNRNLPDVTNKLYEHIRKYDDPITDIYVIEAGSDDDKISKYTTWHAKWDAAKVEGLRYNRGMNYGLSKLYKEGRFENYEAFFLLTNDTELENKNNIEILMNILYEHNRIGILSPCSTRWGEINLLNKCDTKYFWFIHNNAYLLRKEFIKSICNFDELNHMKFLFDGTNFRGFGTEHEIIAKAYVNDWSAAITKKVISTENETHLFKKASIIKTDNYQKNIELYIKEGKEWMQKKYGFNSHWAMQQYTKMLYDKFFEYSPHLIMYKI